MRLVRAFLVFVGLVVVLLSIVVGLAMARGGPFLRVNSPHHADVILILGGGLDDSRYYRAVQLMKAGYGNQIVFDAEAFFTKYARTNADLAKEFLQRIHDRSTIVCPLQNDSTYGETEDVARCLAPLKISSVLIVTSDYHTRRALSIFKARLPKYQWYILGAYAPLDKQAPQKLTADDWWKTRAWAKTMLDEWEKLIWWELVDRWRPHLVVQS